MIQLKKCARKGPFELMCRFILLCRFCHHRTSRKGMCRLVAQDCIQCWQHCMILWCVCKKNKNYLLPKKKKKAQPSIPAISQSVLLLCYLLNIYLSLTFSGKEPPANAGYTRDIDLILGSGRSPGVRNGNLFQYSCL